MSSIAAHQAQRSPGFWLSEYTCALLAGPARWTNLVAKVQKEVDLAAADAAPEPCPQIHLRR
jgi:hypothetical protein